MTTSLRVLVTLTLLASLCFSCHKHPPEEVKSELGEQEAKAIGIEAYIYGYPLVTMEMTRRVMTNVAAPEGSKAPMEQFANSRVYPNSSFKDVTAPNADTLYSTAWLNLSKEPYVFHVPDENGRYYLMPIISGWTEVIASPGTRTTGTEAADYVITGPDWKEKLPQGLKEIKSPTNMIWILGRTYSTGTPEDYKVVHAIQDQYTLTPLSSFGESYLPPKGIVDPNIDMQTPVRDQVDGMDAETYFTTLAQLMNTNPPTALDAFLIAKMAKIGLIPGQPFEMTKLDPPIAEILKTVPKIALKKIAAHEKDSSKMVNGWVYTTQTGTYGTDYLQRAMVAMIGLGANLPQDAVYPLTNVDHQGQPLNGAYRYRIHFAKEELPPVKGFWSLTLYDDHYFFAANSLNRYALSPRNSLKYNEDGSLDLFIQHESPGAGKESNWLPAPEGPFNLMLRLYWPEESILNGTWKPPAVLKDERL